MPMVEVDEEQLRRDTNLRATVAKMMKDPKAKRLMQEAEKLAFPDVPVPELDAEKKIEEATSATKAEIEALKKQLADDKQAREDQAKLDALEARIEKSFDRLRREHRLTDEGVEAVRKLMNEEGITNPEIAWNHFEKLHPPATPVVPGGQGAWNFLDAPSIEGDADLKKLIETKGESSGLIDKMAQDALAEIRGQARR